MFNYKNIRWRKTREYILRRDKYLCQQSLRFGRNVEADTVHHIFPVEFYPELKYEYWNLISLCSTEHNKLHQRTEHNLTDEGIRLQKRFRKRYLNWCEKTKNPPHFDN